MILQSDESTKRTRGRDKRSEQHEVLQFGLATRIPLFDPCQQGKWFRRRTRDNAEQRSRSFPILTPGPAAFCLAASSSGVGAFFAILALVVLTF